MVAAVSNPNPFLRGKQRPVVVGHRGVPALHQENTIAGFKRAVSLGVPAVECDVQLTKDKQAVVIHDSHLERLTGCRRWWRDLCWLCRSRSSARAGISAPGCASAASS